MMDKPYVTVGELAEHLGCQVLGNKNKKIFEISLYQDSNEDSLTYVPYQKINQIPDIGAGAILTKVSIGLPLHRNYIICKHEPHEMLPDVIAFLIEKGLYGCEISEKPMLSETSEVAETVSIQNGAIIGDHTILSPGVSIGRNVKIGSHCVIGANTVIGDHCTIGDDVQIGTCCSIGTENFEYHKFQDEWRKIPAIGTVSIGNHVRIGGNIVIEKGTIGTTTIGDFTQIENLVQIGHEAKIGIQCHIVSLVAIAGWAEIGNYVDIYGQSAISNHVKIGDHSILLARSGVDKNVDQNMVISGFPAQQHRNELKYQAFLRKLFRKNTKERGDYS